MSDGFLFNLLETVLDLHLKNKTFKLFDYVPNAADENIGRAKNIEESDELAVDMIVRYGEWLR